MRATHVARDARRGATRRTLPGETHLSAQPLPARQPFSLAGCFLWAESSAPANSDAYLIIVDLCPLLYVLDHVNLLR